MIQNERPESNSRRSFFDPRLAPTAPHPLGEAVDALQFNASRLRQLFTDQANPTTAIDWQPDQISDRVRFSSRPITAAAVLVPIVMHPEGFTVLLTERSGNLNDHAGQVAFPGGRFDDEDESLERTAVREAHEEVGLHPDAVEIIGRLPNYQTGSGFIVTPVVALVAPNQTLSLQVDEVADAFEVPLQFLLDPTNHERRRYLINNAENVEEERHFYAMPWMATKTTSPLVSQQRAIRAVMGKEYFIWGATAAMLRNLYRFLSSAR